MDDIAAFKLDSLPDITFTVTRAISSGGKIRQGFSISRRAESNRRSWVVEAVLDRWARKRSILHVFAAGRCRSSSGRYRVTPSTPAKSSRVGDPEGPTLLAGFGNIPETSQRSPGWIRITCKGPDDDEELEFFGFAGPES